MSLTENDVFRPRILLAEDNPDHQQIIGLMLGKMGADVTFVENGQSAVARALQAQEEGDAWRRTVKWAR